MTHRSAFRPGALLGLDRGDPLRQAVFWRDGQLASAGIQAMAELGSKSRSAMRSPRPLAPVRISTCFLVKGSDRLRVRCRSTFRSGFPSLVTLVTMIAPSPDWFVGVADFPLLRNDRWVDSLTVELRGWDAGTDDGATYVAMNAPAIPHVPISALEDCPFRVGGEVPPLGTYTFVRRR